jgi:hypothetical protein
LDPLLVGDGGALAADGGNPCAACIQQSCGAELTALETELKTLRTEATTAFTCVRDSNCLSLFWASSDAGPSAGRAAVAACIAACDADAGLPARDAARSAVGMLASALDQCVDSSCTAQCPGAANDVDDREAGSSPPLPPPPFDGGFPHCDAGFPHFGGPLSPPPFPDSGFFPGFGRR